MKFWKSDFRSNLDIDGLLNYLHAINTGPHVNIAVGQQAIARANDDPDVCRITAPLGHGELRDNVCIANSIKRKGIDFQDFGVFKAIYKYHKWTMHMAYRMTCIPNTCQVQFC